jgi:hypothetical protein
MNKKKKTGEAFAREMLTMFANVTEVQLGIMITKHLADPNIRISYHKEEDKIALELSQHQPTDDGLAPVAEEVVRYLKKGGVDAELTAPPKRRALIEVPRDQFRNMLDNSLKEPFGRPMAGQDNYTLAV